jgi:nitrilase
MRAITAGVVQAGSLLFDTKRTLAKLADLTADSARRGAKLVVFPEAFVGGYPKGIDFGARVGSRTPEGRELFHRYFDSAIDVPGPEFTRIGEIAKKAGVDLVVGVMERDGGTLYCSVLCFDAGGRYLGKRRKLMPTAMERLIWGFGDGSTLETWRTENGIVGATICWENYMPMLRMNFYAQNVELYCAPTVDDRDTWAPTMQTIAMEGRCFVLSASQFMTRADAPADYKPVQGDAPDTVLIRGGSCIVAPLGTILAGPVFGKETILTAELDPAEITRGKFDFDVVGHYARADLFELHVNRKAQRAVPPANTTDTL